MKILIALVFLEKKNAFIRYIVCDVITTTSKEFSINKTLEGGIQFSSQIIIFNKFIPTIIIIILYKKMLKRAIFSKVSRQFLSPFSPLSNRAFSILNYHFVANLTEDQLAV